jgi:hypothetical protein
MRVTTIGWMVAAMMSVLVAGLGLAAGEAEPGGGMWNDPKISAAVEKVRKGETADLLRLTSKAKPKSSWKPEKKNLPKYHECLSTNENPQVQFFAVAAISRLKDKSSVEPLQKFILTANHRLQEGSISHDEEEKEPAKAAQRRQKGGLLSREEAVMLQLSIGGAMETLGEIDDDSDVSVAFLGTLLKHDMGKEWGGGVAHSALAKKGAPGLRRLLEESLTAEGKQRGYVGAAIHDIRNPALFGALAAACLDPKYSDKIGNAALGAIAGMRDKVPQAEQFIIDMMMRDEKSNVRLAAVSCVAEFGTEKGFKLLREIRNSPGKGGPELVNRIDYFLVKNDTDNMIDGIVNSILSAATPDGEKIRLCGEVALLDDAKVLRHASKLIPCLSVENSAGEPLNEARIDIWRVLFSSTKVKHPLTLAYESDQQFERQTSSIQDALRREISYKQPQDYLEADKKAKAETRQRVTKWVKDKTEKTGGGK